MMNAATNTAVGILERLRGDVRRRALRQGSLVWAAVTVVAVTGAVALAGGEHFRGGVIASLLSALVLALSGGTAWRFLWRPWRRHGDRTAFARSVEAAGAFANVVIAAEDAARRPAMWAEGDAVARELARRLDARAQDALAGLDPARVERGVPVRRWAVVLVGATTLAGLLIATRPESMLRGGRLLLQPWVDPAETGFATLVAEPSPPWVVAGGSLTLAAVDFAPEPGLVVAEVRFGDAAWRKIAVTTAAPATATGAVAGPRRRWLAGVDDVREDFGWRFRRGDEVTAIGRVAVRQRPLLTALSARVEPPAYTRLPAVDVERLPTVSEVPAGSHITLRGEAGQALRDAWLSIASGDSLPLRVSGSSAAATLTVTDALAFSVGLRDDHGLESRDRLQYQLNVVADQPPVVALTRSDDDGLLPLDGRVRLLAMASDDYGLRRLELNAGAGGVADGGPAVAGLAIGPRGSGDWQTLSTTAGTLRVRAGAEGPQDLPLQAALALEIDAGQLDLMPGDVLELSLTARDNREPGGGQWTRSAVLRLALPSAADVLAGQAESAEQSRGELEEARRRGRQLDVDLERLARELLKNPLPDWARQQEIEAALERQQMLQRELSRVAEQLREQMDRLASGQLTSEAQLERVEQIAELLAQPTGQELAALLEKLRQDAGRTPPDEIARAMNEVTRAQKDLARRLDAALALLERMSDEQRLEGLTSLLEEMMRRQQELADESRRLDGSAPRPPRDRSGEPESAAPEASDLARRQEALERELEQLKEKLEQALSEMASAKGKEKSEQPERTGASQESQEPADEGNKEGQEAPPESGDSADRDPESGTSPREQALREALEKLKQQQASGSMGKASQMLQQMDPKQAAQMQQQALRDLGSLYSVLLASQQAMQSAMKMEQVSSLRGLAADLLALSARQEELAARIPPRVQDTRNVELTRQQHRLQKAALGTRDRLSGLLKEAPNRILKLLEKLDALIEDMGAGVRALEEGRAAAAREQASASLAATNRIVIGLLTEAQMAGNGGGGGGQQQSPSEQLQELARQQAELNGATEELRRMLADRGISQEARSRMQRLGEQQAELGRELGRVAEQERERPATEGARLLGDMTELGRQMERVGGDLGDGLVDQDVLQRQDRILGRLLDARNAVRERDYSSRRESRAARRPFEAQTGAGAGDDPGRDAALRQRYRRLEEAPLEYRELVRRYFAAIDSLQAGRGAPAVEVLP